MVKITSQLKVLSNIPLLALLRAVLMAVVIFALSQHHDLWPLAVIVIFIAEVGLVRPPGGVHRGDVVALVLRRMPAILMGISASLIIAVVPRFVSQVMVAILYGVVRLWWSTDKDDAATSLPGLLVVTAALFEALFLMAAVWRTAEWLILALVWLAAWTSVYAVLKNRAERVAGVMAATWALVCTEISWVLLRWLFTYTVTGGYILVPQPMLILTALAYCFGSIYVSQRKGSLSRARLTEYLLIGLILIAIVVTGTPWRGSL